MRISHFPDFLPDETVYSVASRYMDNMQFLSHSTVSQHFFGGRDKGLVTDLPSSLEHLIQSLPHNHIYTADMIINQHTLFPIYAPFLSSTRALTLRQHMKNNNYFAIHTLAGITSGKVPRPQWLKFCPACVDYDRLRYGECYWHRIHQVSGVLVCPIHEIMLEDSNINLLRGNNIPKFHSAESIVVNLPQRIAPSHLHTALVQLAHKAKWLLECWTAIEQWSIKQEYLQHLTNRGFVTAAGLVRYVKLKAAILDYYPSGLLEILGCTTTKSKDIWFENWTHIQHPLHHLLFIQFLCETIQEFFTKSQHYVDPFGNGPWPCLNPLCSDYKECVITSYTVKQGENNQPVGTFNCHCGFTYSRKPDQNNATISRKGRTIVRYGDAWDLQLTTYWLDRNISTSQIAHSMGTDIATIQRQAARLNLPFAPEIARRGKRPRIYQDCINEQRIAYRTLWEEALKSNPYANLRDVIKAAQKAYSWLKRHDRDWLKEHHPILASRSNNERLLSYIAQTKRTYHSQIDADLAAVVRKAADKIYTALNFPTQVTRRILVAQIGNAALTKKSDLVLDNLPITSRALKEVMETDVAFIWRKLNWAVQSFLAEQIYPAYYLFLRRARISSLTSEHPIYKRLIKFAYYSLQTGTSLNKQMPEDIVKKLDITSSSIENVEDVTSGSLAFILLKEQSMLSRTLKRQKSNTYQLIPILLLTVAAIMNGAENYNAIARWSYQNEDWLSKFGLPKGHFPPAATIKRRCGNVNIESFEDILEVWLRDSFLLLQDETNIIEELDRSSYVPGLRILRSYRHIASEIVTKLC